MSFIQNVMEAIVRAGGHQVPYTEERLKEIQKQQAETQKKMKSNGFGRVLLGMQQIQQQNQLQMPTPPTPPANPNNPEAQRKYNDALLAYNQQFQKYHTNLIGNMFQRFAMMQQVMQQSLFRLQQSQSSSSSSSSSSTLSASPVAPDFGSILGTESEES